MSIDRVLKALGWDRVTNQVYHEILFALEDNPPWGDEGGASALKSRRTATRSIALSHYKSSTRKVTELFFLVISLIDRPRAKWSCGAVRRGPDRSVEWIQTSVLDDRRNRLVEVADTLHLTEPQSRRLQMLGMNEALVLLSGAKNGIPIKLQGGTQKSMN